MTSARVGFATRSLYANSGTRAKWVPTNNQRGRGTGPCLIWKGIDKSRHIVPATLLVRVQRSRKDMLLMGWTHYLNNHCVILSTSKAFHYFRARRNEFRFAFDPPYFVDYVTVEDRLGDSFRNIFLKWYFTKFGQKPREWPEELSKCISKLFISVTMCHEFFEWFEVFWNGNPKTLVQHLADLTNCEMYIPYDRSLGTSPLNHGKLILIL